MVTPLNLLNLFARPARRSRPIGRCPVCHEEIRDPEAILTLRGGITVHRTCATYRVRQRALTR